MPADYAEVLKDLDSQIAALEAEIDTLRAGRPTIVLLRNKYPLVAQEVQIKLSDGPYAQMGTTSAIPYALKGEVFPLPTTEITDRLKAGGVKTRGQDFGGNVAATLSRLRDQGIVEKVGDGWILKQSDPAAQKTFSVPAPTPNSFATMQQNHSSSTG